MRSPTTRSLTVPLLLVAGMVGGLLTAAPASAMTTRACTQKGTRSNDTMTVNLTIGGTFVVCAFTGTDTINLRGTVDTTTILVIVLGAGTKTLDLNLTSNGGYYFQSDSAVVRPDAAVTVLLTGSDDGSANSMFFALVCGNSTLYSAAADASDLWDNSGHQVRWLDEAPLASNC
jgi:hypothetical protein